MSKLPALLAALLALSACATTSAPAEGGATGTPRPVTASSGAIAQKQPKVICENEAPLGSHITARKCRAVDDVERTRKQTQLDVLRPVSTPNQRGN